MKNKNLIHTQNVEWEGDKYTVELYDSTDFSSLSPITQVQAICFLRGSDKVVLYKDKNDNYGLPGGSIEEGESLEQTLRRELKEEAAVEVINYEPLLYVHSYIPEDEKEEFGYQVRFWANVELLDQEVNDPDDKAVERVVTDIDHALEKLGWGKKAEIYFEKAKEKRKNN
ncbi:MAG: NUDIX hydrolase [Candidatus Magasanikbacteria bacterium]